MTLLVDRPARPDVPEPGFRIVEVARRPVRRWTIPNEAWLPAGLVFAIMVLHAWNITGYPAVSDDEGTYLSQAWAVQNGLGLAHYTYWYDHPPMGWIQLAGLSWLPTMISPDTLAVATARYAMLPVFAASLALVYLIARRLGFARWAAALAILFLGLSPLSVTLNRQIYLDSFAVLWMLMAIAFALSRRRHLWHHVAAGGAAAISVLSKETMLLVVPAVALALWQNTRRGIRSYSFVGFTSGLILVGAFYPVYAMLKGELFPGADHVSLIGAWQFQLAGRTGSGSMLAAGSGSNALLDAWLFYDNVLPVLGVAATVVGLMIRRLRVPALAVTILTLVAMRPNGYMPAMYIIQALPFLALALAGATEEGVRRLRAVPERTGQVERQIRASVLVAMAVLSAAVVLPNWYVGAQRALTANDNARYVAAAQWLRHQAQIEPRARIVLDDALWLDAVNAGFEQERVIWFYKLDLDPGVMESLPEGWRDVDYLIASPAIRADPNVLPTVGALLTHSDVVASFGTADDRIEIRKIDKEEQQ
jgi:hypothetical protein